MEITIIRHQTGVAVKEFKKRYLGSITPEDEVFISVLVGEVDIINNDYKVRIEKGGVGTLKKGIQYELSMVCDSMIMFVFNSAVMTLPKERIF